MALVRTPGGDEAGGTTGVSTTTIYQVEQQVEAQVALEEEGIQNRTTNITGTDEVLSMLELFGLNVIDSIHGKIDTDSIVIGPNSTQFARKGGVIEDTGSFIAYLYTPPASSQLYIADILNSANIATPAYAQGLGFSSLSPVLEVWKLFRNLAYFFFVVIFLAIGFLIMLRHKVGGQTVVTAQQAIPKTIIALLAVTFSYAIAGVLIDLMYLSMFLLVNIFESSASDINKSLFRIGYDMLVADGLAVDSFDAVKNFIDQALDVGAGPINDVIGLLGGLTFAVIISIAIVIGIFRLFFELLKTYISIIISITLAPITLMLGALPGKNMFGRWVRGLVGNLAAFPIVLLIFILYRKLSETNSIQQGGFVPPFLIGSGSGQAIVSMIGIGLLLIMTDLVKKGKELLGAGKGPFDEFQGALQESLKRGWQGGELVPGLPITKIPGAAKIGERTVKAPAQMVYKGGRAVANQAANRFVVGGLGQLVPRPPQTQPAVPNAPQPRPISQTPRKQTSPIEQGAVGGRTPTNEKF